jgi:shikimate kinase
MVTKIILVGMMGAGKTTIGKLLSNQLGFNFIDLDRKIEEKSGVKINTIFEIEGEEGFREREYLALNDALAQEKVVISTGGGVVVKEINRSLIKKSEAMVIYLKANLDILVGRLKNDKTRPMLDKDNKQLSLQQLLSKREPFYENLADFIIDTSHLKTNDVLKMIIEKIETL